SLFFTLVLDPEHDILNIAKSGRSAHLLFVWARHPQGMAVLASVLIVLCAVSAATWFKRRRRPPIVPDEQEATRTLKQYPVTGQKEESRFEKGRTPDEGRSLVSLAGPRRPLLRNRLIRGTAFCVSLVCVILTTGSSGIPFAKSYSITRVDIEASVNPDGSMDVIEKRTFRFTFESGTRFPGSFTWLSQDLLLAGCQGISGVKVSEDGRDYLPASFGPGTYSVEETHDMVRVTWRFEPTDESRTFELSYRVKGAVVAHRDVAELYWKFVGERWEVSSDNVTVNLRLPQGARLDEVRAWGHGPLSASVRIVSPELITWTLPHLSPGRFLEGRLVFPKRLVPQATNTDDMDVLDSILSEEEAWAARADRERAVTRLVTQSSLFVLAASVAATVVLHILYGRDPKPD
ncbi:MAG: DUF2207 domain-containing protein, partial [Bacillota bacterium]